MAAERNGGFVEGNEQDYDVVSTECACQERLWVLDFVFCVLC